MTPSSRVISRSGSGASHAAGVAGNGIDAGGLEALRTALGDPLPPHAHARILRMLDRLELVCAQIAELERERDAVLEEEAPDKAEEMTPLGSLRHQP